MEVYVCGHNNFNQLNHIKLKFSEEFVAIEDGDGSGKKQAYVHPIIMFSTNNCTAENLNVFFTWSRCLASFKSKDGKCATLVSGFNNEKSSVLVLKDRLCSAVTESAIILRETNTPQNLSALCDGMSHPISVSVRSDEQQTSCVKLDQIAGGHQDFYSVYDGVSFGKFRPSDTGSPSSSENVSEMKMRICHIDSVSPIKEISCGKEHVLLLSTSGNVYSYGLSSRGQLGHGEIENESSPRLVDALDGLAVKTIAAGGWHSTAVSEIGDLYVWGWNESGQLGLVSVKAGDGVTTKTHTDDVGIVATPECVDVPDGENVKGVACGSRHTVVLTEMGKIFTCGWNAYGQLGVGDTSNRNTLTRVGGLIGCKVFAGPWNSALLCEKDVAPSFMSSISEHRAGKLFDQAKKQADDQPTVRVP